jgi:hypothetical protein
MTVGADLVEIAAIKKYLYEDLDRYGTKSRAKPVGVPERNRRPQRNRALGPFSLATR